MKKRNIVLISMDELRPDHLGCYGYKRVKTLNIDRIAEGGVLFETCMAASCFTPICMSSVLCGCYPNKHTIRNSFCRIQAPTIAEILKESGYKTAGFVGVGVLGAKHGFGNGFDLYDEPTRDTGHQTWEERDGQRTELIYEGNRWYDRMFEWVKANRSSTFFVWGHFYETHEGSEHSLLRDGLIKKGELSEFRYYDAKIKFLDEKFYGKLLQLFDELNLWKDTIIVLMSDHGTNLGEHPAKPIPHRSGNIRYPQHRTLYDVNTRVVLIMNSKGLPQRKRVKQMVRSVDVIPTLLDLVRISTKKFDFDGLSLFPMVLEGKPKKLTAYAEDLYGYGIGVSKFQAFRTESFKFIRDLSKGTEEFYNLQSDPMEQNNLITEIRRSRTEELKKIRDWLTDLLWKSKGAEVSFSEAERTEIEERLRRLGYIE